MSPYKFMVRRQWADSNGKLSGQEHTAIVSLEDEDALCAAWTPGRSRDQWVPHGVAELVIRQQCAENQRYAVAPRRITVTHLREDGHPHSEVYFAQWNADARGYVFPGPVVKVLPPPDGVSVVFTESWEV